MRLVTLICAAVTASACGGGSPTAPSPVPQAPLTRIIALSGSLSFSNVVVGRTASASLTISNTGTGPMTVTGLTAGGGLSASWTGGTIAAGGSQVVSINFAPTAPGDYSGSIAVAADFTSGSNVAGVSASAVPNVLGAWSGTQAISALGQSLTCNMTWIISDQQGISFRGTWQSSGSCGQSGTLDGAVTSSSTIQGLQMNVTVGPITCTRIAGDGRFNGAISSTTITVQATETTRCVGIGDLTRAITLQVRKQ